MKRIFSLITVICAFVLMISTVLPPAYAAEETSIVASPTSYMIPSGGDVTFMTEAKGESLNFEWFIRYNGKDFPAFAAQETAGAKVYEAFDSATLSREENQSFLKLSGVNDDLNNAGIYCIVRGSAGIAVTTVAIVQVAPAAATCDATEMHLRNINVKENSFIKYALRTYEEEGATYHYTWYRTSTDDLSTIKADVNSDDSMVLILDTQQAGTFYMTCMVEKTRGGKTNRTYSSLARVVIAAENADPSYTMGVEVQKAPSKKAYKVGESIDISGLTLRGMTGQGYFTVSDTDKIKVFPNNIYSTEQNSLAVVYDGCAASVPVNVSPNAGTKFGIYAVSELNYTTYIPNQEFSLEAAAQNANSEVTFKWYNSDENGSQGSLLGSGSKYTFKNGIPVSDAAKTAYYLCVAECDGISDSLLFSTMLMPPDTPDDPTDAPATAVPATDVPATGVPATDVPATAAPATDIPATQEPATQAPATGDPAEPTEAPTGPAVNETSAPAATEGGQSAPVRSGGLSTGALIGIIGGILGAGIIIGIAIIIAAKIKKS
ncbi:MAG: hypothetical protein J6Y21_00075 [Clostridia bacterium]|nr:hypothetical protein [Clostridia bacterium]